MIEGSLSWDVTLPERGQRATSWQRPRARLLIDSQTHGSEALTIPVAVGRRLLKVRESGSLEPSSRAELIQIVADLSEEVGHSRIEDLIGRRDLSRAELSKRLLEEGYWGRVVDGLVERAQACGLVDDARFGAAFARSKVLSGWGRLKIERELASRGVDPQAIEGWPEDFLAADEERERALELASRRRLTGKNDYAKLVRFLCSRGFSLALSSDVAKERLNHEN